MKQKDHHGVEYEVAHLCIKRVDATADVEGPELDGSVVTCQNTSRVDRQPVVSCITLTSSGVHDGTSDQEEYLGFLFFASETENGRLDILAKEELFPVTLVRNDHRRYTHSLK